MALIAWRLLEGLPAYPAFDEPGRISNLYGPVTYLVHAMSYLLAGPGLAVGKAAGIFAVLLIPVVVFLAQRSRGPEIGLAATVLAAGFILLGLPATIWNRPDSIIAVLVALSVWAMNRAGDDHPAWARSLAIGLCGGLAVGMKIHAGIYFVPVVLFHCWRRGAKVFAAVCVAGVAAALAPVASELFSLSSYLSWFPLMAAKETDLGLLVKVLRYALFYLTPVIFFAAGIKWAEGAIDRADAVYFWTFVGCVALLFVLAAKPGAGWYYLFPFVAVSIDMILRFSGKVTRNTGTVHAGIAVVAAIMLVVSVPVQKRFYHALHWGQAAGIAAEVQDIMRRNTGRTIEMGVGQDVVTYRRTLYKTLLVLSGHPYTIDAAVIIGNQ